MNLTLQCPSCHKDLEVDPAWSNQQVECPLCTSSFIVPPPQRKRKWVLPLVISLLSMVCVAAVLTMLTQPSQGPALQSITAPIIPEEASSVVVETPTPDPVKNPTPVVVPFAPTASAAQPPLKPTTALPFKSDPTPANYKILGETEESLAKRYGPPSKETQLPTVEGAKAQIFDDMNRRIIVTYMEGKAVQVMVVSKEEIPPEMVDGMLLDNSEGATFVPQKSVAGQTWERDDDKVSAMHGKAISGYVFAIASKALKEKLDASAEAEVDSVLPSVSEWRAKAKSILGTSQADALGSRRMAIQNSEAFLAAVGKPDAEGQQGQFTAFSWKCRDGVIVMLVNAKMWHSAKVLMVEHFEQSEVETKGLSDLTVTEWLTKARKVLGEMRADALGTARVAIEDSKPLFSAVGEPTRQAQQGGFILFVWRCQDGQVIMQVNAQIWQSKQMLIVEDFAYSME